MKFGVLALDYDGTISNGAGVHPEVRAAIGEARARGIAVLLVTGRVVPELRREIGDLRLFDAVVAENGGVLLLPDSGRLRVLGHPPPAEFLDALRDAGVSFSLGLCVIEADADAAPAFLKALRRLQTPVVLVFNRDRLMALPQGVSKATGLHEALESLRLSGHNAIAIGDAENDHPLLEAVEIGAAVAWGSPALRAIADHVIVGQDPGAVATYIRQAYQQPHLSPPRSTRRTLLLGRTADDQPLMLSVLGRNVLIAGDPRSGKSWVAGLLCEQLILHRYSVCVIDPEGDYRPLDSLPGVIVIQAHETPLRLADLARLLSYPDFSVVVDLSRLRPDGKRDQVRSLLLLLRELRRRAGLPHRVVVDEAHYFLHDEDVAGLIDDERAGYTLVTYRATALHSAVRASVGAVIVTRETDPLETAALAAAYGAPGDREAWTETLAHLPLDEAALLPSAEEAAGQLRRFRIAARLTHHVRHKSKYVDVPVPASQAFVFTRDGLPIGVRIRTLADFAQTVIDVEPEVLIEHLRRGDVSRWLNEVFGDRELAERARELENRVQLSGHADVADALVEIIEDRYGSAYLADRSGRRGDGAWPSG